MSVNIECTLNYVLYGKGNTLEFPKFNPIEFCNIIQKISLNIKFFATLNGKVSVMMLLVAKSFTFFLQEDKKALMNSIKSLSKVSVQAIEKLNTFP